MSDVGVLDFSRLLARLNLSGPGSGNLVGKAQVTLSQTHQDRPSFGSLQLLPSPLPQYGTLPPGSCRPGTSGSGKQRTPACRPGTLS